MLCSVVGRGNSDLVSVDLGLLVVGSTMRRWGQGKLTKDEVVRPEEPKGPQTGRCPWFQARGPPGWLEAHICVLRGEGVGYMDHKLRYPSCLMLSP